MDNIPSFNSLIEKTIVNHWEKDALTDYKGATLQYHDVARKIEKLHIMIPCISYLTEMSKGFEFPQCSSA